MKKILVLCFAMMLFGAASTKAQGILDKVDHTLNKADNASNEADRAGNTANRAGKIGSKIGGLFGKKKSAEAGGQTIVNISGADLSTVKSIVEKAENTKGVASAKMKFNSSMSSITLQHDGTTNDLLKALQKTNPAVFADKNIEGIDDGQISVKLQK